MAENQYPIPSTSSHFWMHPEALRITLNALDDSSLLAVSVYANAAVLAYHSAIIGYAPDKNYRTWRLSAFNTHFDDQQPRYCHIALSRSTDAALVVYPTTRLDILGRPITDDGRYFLDDAGQPIIPDNADDASVPVGSAAEEDPDSYYIFIGLIELQDGKRHWSQLYPFVTGDLDTDQHRNEERNGQLEKMFVLNEVMGWIEQLLPIYFSHIISLALGFGRKILNDVFKLYDVDPDTATDQTIEPTITADLDTVVPTEAHMRDYISTRFLSKKDDDTAEGNIRFKKNIAVLGDITTEGTTGSADFQPNLFGHGWRITNEGHGELDSLSLRKFLEVPELRFNRISVRTGVQWQTFGGGLIEAVYPDPNGNPRRGIIKLHLEDGEYGAISPDDKCMGIFHFETPTAPAPVPDGSAADPNYTPTGTDPSTLDDHNGNFLFAGFTTIYFRVIALCDEAGNTAHPDPSNRYFIYELRPDWTTSLSQQINAQHPQPSMSFAAYANARDKDRQACEYSTTEYTIQLAGMTDWTYGSSNIQYIYGHLAGFTIDVQVPTRDANGNIIYNPDGTTQTHTEHFPLTGYGIGVGNIYRWGNERTLERPKQLLTQQLYYTASPLAPEQFFSTVQDGSAAPTWQTDPISPTATLPYIYAYWLKTYIEGGVESQERSAPFLFATFGESPITYRWSTPVVPINVARSGWIIDDEPPTITQVSPIQHITATVCLVKGIDDYQPISAVTLADQPSFITSLNSQLSTLNSAEWQIDFDVTGFDSDQTVTVPFTITTAAGETIPAPLLLAPSFAGTNGHDGSDGSNGNDAVIIEIEPSQNNFVADPDAVEMVTPSITFSVYRIVGNKRREPLQGYYYNIRFLNDEGEQLIKVPARGAYTDAYSITVNLADDQNAAAMAMDLNTIRFAVIDTDGTELKVLNVTRVNAGESGPPGPPGNDGTDAVMYEIEPTSEVIRTNTAGSATARWGCRLYRIIGSTRAEYNDAQWDITITKPSLASVNETASGSSFFLSATTIGAVASITVKAFDNSIADKRRLVSTRIFYAVADGAPGLQGVVIRQRGLWNQYSEYVNQSESKRTDLRYIDIVQVKHDNIIDYYECKPTADGAVNIGHDPTAANWQTYWIKADYQEFIATQLLLAQNAAIEFGQNNQLLIMDVNGEIVGGFTGFTIDENGDPKQNPIRLWVGAAEPADAPFHVKHDGTLVSANVNSDFQDLSGLSSEAYDNMSKQQSIVLEDVRNGTPLYNSAGVRVPINPRIYNIIANRSCIVLPTDIAYIGQRVLICNTEDVLSFDPTDGTQVVQHFPGDDDSSFDITFCGAGLWARHWYEQDINGITVDRGERYVSATSIAFLNGTMEFVGIPYVHKGVPCCRWSLITDGTCIKWFACEYHVVGSNDKQYDWHSVMNYNN